MPLFAEAWTALNRVRRRVRKPSSEDWQAARRDWIREHARGASFADIGGLFGLAGEFAFLAEEAGATRVSLFDAGDAELTTFPAERARRGSSVRVVQGDLHDAQAIQELGPHDVVWCSGVIYHTPDPLHQLLQLRRITRKRLFLGSRTIPEVPGLPQACLFYPYLDERTRRTLARPYWRPESAPGIGAPFDDRPMLGHGNFWWGITPSALRAMLRTARFEIVEEPRAHDTPWYTQVVARPVDADPILPPVSYYRRRSDTQGDGSGLPFEDFYASLREAGRDPWLDPDSF